MRVLGMGGMQQKISLERVAFFGTKAAAETVADRIADARTCPVVDLDREPVGWIVEHRSGEARLSESGEWI